MTKTKLIEVYDPALCCSTGVCGPSPDQELVNFASVVKEAREEAEIRRYNLAQQPAAFSENAEVKKILEDEGTDALPAIFINGKLAMKGVYPSKAQLARLVGVAGDCCREDDACCSRAEEEATKSCC